MGKTFPRYDPLDEYPAADKNDLNTWVESVLPQAAGEIVIGVGPGVFPAKQPISSYLGATQLSQLSDVADALAPTDGQVLAYNAGAGQWANATGTVVPAGANVGDVLTRPTWQVPPVWLRSPAVNARAYGAVGDGVSNDTTPLQNWLNDCVNAALPGYLPPGNYLITAPLNVARRPGWAILGSGRESTIITQATDNVAILNLGSDTASSMHSFRIEGMKLTYSNVQPSTNTSAVPIYFNDNGFEGAITDIDFQRGAYGIQMKTGIVSFWGMTFDRLWFSSELTIGAIHNNTGSGAIPNNRYGHLMVDANTMIGPIFNLKGYNAKIMQIEILNALLGPQLMSFAAGAEFVIDAIKLEIGAYGTAKDLISIGQNSDVQIGLLSISGSSITFSATCYAINSGVGGGGGRTTVGLMRLGQTGGAAKLYGFQGNTLVTRRCGQFTASGGPQLVNSGSTTTADNLVVDTYLNHRISTNKGDANVTIALGDPNITCFQTAFTAPRTLTIPDVRDDLHNGLYYEVIINGAINSTNTLTIKAGTTTLRTITTDGVVVRFTWRRNAANGAGGWVLNKHDVIAT